MDLCNGKESLVEVCHIEMKNCKIIEQIGRSDVPYLHRPLRKCSHSVCINSLIFPFYVQMHLLVIIMEVTYDNIVCVGVMITIILLIEKENKKKRKRNAS
jgi:hypothetical protein